jgi:hypothetical protein
MNLPPLRKFSPGIALVALFMVHGKPSRAEEPEPPMTPQARLVQHCRQMAALYYLIEANSLDAGDRKEAHEFTEDNLLSNCIERPQDELDQIVNYALPKLKQSIAEANRLSW